MTKITQPFKSFASDKPSRNGVIDSLWLAGRAGYWQKTFKPGTRDYLVKCVAHYLFYGDPDRRVPAMGYGKENQRADWLLYWYEKAFPRFKQKRQHVARSVQWAGSQHSHEASDRYIARRMANDKKRRTAAEKVEAAYLHCRETGQEPTQTKVAKLSGCHPNTVKKHLANIQSKVHRISTDVLTCSYGGKQKRWKSQNGSKNSRTTAMKKFALVGKEPNFIKPSISTGSNPCLILDLRRKTFDPRSTEVANGEMQHARWQKIQKQLIQDLRYERRIITEWCGELC